MRRKLLLLMLALALVATPGRAQSLAGVWQGREIDPEQPGNWPSVLRVQATKDGELFGVLYQEVETDPGVSVTFKVKARRTTAGMRMEHVLPLFETGRTPFHYWCDGYINFTYDARLEKLSGQATYRPEGNCNVGRFELYRVKLKSAATVAAGVPVTHYVSGRSVRWYADEACQKLLGTGNTYRAALRKTTTFFITQEFYPTKQGAVVPITIRVTGSVPAPTAPRPVRRDTTTRRPPVLQLSSKPLVLPTVLFRQGTAELLPEARPALEQLAQLLISRPSLRIRVTGHTDRIGEAAKNLVLSRQRAEAVQQQLVQAGVAAERIQPQGAGDTQLLFPAPDARNRRVEVQVLE